MSKKKSLEMRVKRGEKAKRFPFAPKHKGDVGFDLVSVETTVVPPGAGLAPTDIPVDVHVKLPPGTWAMIIPRSGMYARFAGLVVCNAPIDNGYTGPLSPRVRNHSRKIIVVPEGVAIAQLVLFPIIIPFAVDVDALPTTERGEKGLGSTDALKLQPQTGRFRNRPSARCRRPLK